MNEENIQEEILSKLKPHGFENFHDKNKFGKNALMFTLDYNHTEKLYFNLNYLDYLIKNSNLLDKNEEGWNALMFSLFLNNTEKLYLQEDQWNYLLKNSDLSQITDMDANALMFSVIYSHSQKINWTEHQWNYLIQHTDVTQKIPDQWNAFMYTLKNYDSNPKFIIHKIWEKMSEEQKQETFQSVCNAYQKKELHEKDILFVLYELRFKPSQKLINNLKIKKQEEVLQMIEKRNVLWNLKGELSEENKSKNVFKI